MSLIAEILRGSDESLAARKKRRSFRDLKTMARDAQRAPISFRDALARNPFSVIAEIKHESPSAGKMDPSNVERALETYLACPSVSAISILTNEKHFGGSLEHLRKARKVSTKPLLRKDFITDEYQVWEARAFGADAILLMAGLHRDRGRLHALFDVASELKMDVLFEIGMSIQPLEEQASMIPPGAVIVGVNSRGFHTSKMALRSRAGRMVGKDLMTDLSRHHELWPLIPPDKLAVAESGIENPSELGGLEAVGYRAALIGTAFLRKGVSVARQIDGFDRFLRQRSLDFVPATSRLATGAA